MGKTQYSNAPTTHSQTTSPQATTSTSEKTSESETQKPTKESTTSNSNPNHSSARGVFDEPTRGPVPFSNKGTLIVFEDPSCPNCLHFEKETYPKLKRNYIDKGDLSLVYRSFPVVEKWGVDATHALEAVYLKNEQSFWNLKKYYFDNQDQFDTDNIFDKTKRYLEKNTSLNGEEIIRNAESKAVKANINEDLTVGKRAGIRGTPTFFAFRSERYITEIIGRQSYSIFKNVLGL
ncbi:DsbA family protein [Haladaptatus caseinilyticus]|uniref:DsbA family protein n=1 Tax=Haladaptatus caseinilyticus TaxID=2993314 RepID=UPI00224B3D8C|nr:thioredoxin domain-containing protein [Haladaptatus caseinilyticus]